MSSLHRAAVVALLAAAFSVVSPAPAGAATAIDLGTAGSFGVLAGSGITNSGDTRITGDVGSFGSSTAMTGFESVTLIGVNHGGDAVTQQAKDDLTTAYDQAFASAPATDVATELGGRTLTPGVYRSDTLGITGTVSLDMQGDPNAVFVFQAGSTLITAAASSVVVLGGATACNVFWQVGSSATFGANSTFVGNVLAAQSISVGDGTTVHGRLLARVGAVTLLHDTINATTCAATTAPGDTAAATPTAATAAAAAPTPTTPASTATATPTATAVPAPVPTGGRTTATTTRPAAGTSTGVGRPGLATTGEPVDGLPLVGAGTIAVGLALLRASRRRPPLRHGIPRRG